MTAHCITVSIDFSYGHRLLGHAGKCRHLHGHNGRMEIDIASDHLNELGMVADFSDVKAVAGAWIDENLDHRTILCERDPLVSALRQAGENPFLIEENPTAEVIAKHAFRAVRAAELSVTEVRLWETPDSRATYREEIAL